MHITKGKESSIDQWVSDLKIGNNDWFDEVYKDNRIVFLKWIERNHKLNKDEAMDIYQNSMIVLFENVKHNKINKLESSVSTYIFGIAKNLIYKYYHKNELINRHEVRLNEHYSFMSISVEEAETQHPLVLKKLDSMKEPCQTILKLFYVEGLKLSLITDRLGYATVDVVKTQKSRCLRKLKEIFK